MSSIESPSEKYALNALPLPVLTRILGYLCPHHPFRARTNRLRATYYLPFRDPPVTLSLDCGNTLTVPLPDELVSPALASPILAAAAANLLGDRVSFLTHCNTNGQLSAWITAFAPYVKAVSFSETFFDWWDDDFHGEEEGPWLSAILRRFDQSVKVFRTIAVHAIRLEVLDLMDVPFPQFSLKNDDLMVGLCATLENSSSTLRELALPVYRDSYFCDEALQMCSLKKLEVFSVKHAYKYARAGPKELEPPFLRMIRAIDGHADRSRKLTTLRELRFLNAPFLEYDYVTPSDRKSSVFFSVKTLRLVMGSVSDITPQTTLFVFLFKNLERLLWNFSPPTAGKLLKKLCAKVPEVHLSASRWFTDSREVGDSSHFKGDCLFVGESSSDVSAVDITSEKLWFGSIRSLSAGNASQTDLRNVMTCCPNLENLSVTVSRENMRTIRKLVEKCQQMKCLELVIHEEENGRLGEEDWRYLSRTIPKSHKNLCQVAIQNVGHHAAATTYVEAVFSCFETVTKAIGERARRLAFRMLFRTGSSVRIMERVCRLVNTCIEHTPALESLEVVPRMRYPNRTDYRGDREQAIIRRWRNVENRLIHEIQSLWKVDLDGSAKMWQLVDWDQDALDTDRKGSERESGWLM